MTGSLLVTAATGIAASTAAAALGQAGTGEALLQERQTILVSGATGYVGGLLVPELLERGYGVRVMARTPAKVEGRWDGVDVVRADAMDLESLREAMRGVDAAYFMMHSLNEVASGHLESTEVTMARNFRMAAEQMNVGRIIYLSGLGSEEDSTALSPHLASRLAVESELRSGQVPVTTLRAAVILGAGSASFDLLHGVVQSLPVLLMPPWTRTVNQPIGIRDVLRCLAGVLQVHETAGNAYDMGGEDVVTYRQLLKYFAEAEGRRRLFVPFPFGWVGFFSYCAGLLTPLSGRLVHFLIEGAYNAVVCRDDNVIHRLVGNEPMTAREAVFTAVKSSQGEIESSWTDASPPHEPLEQARFSPGEMYSESFSLATSKPADSLFASIKSHLGGKRGWGRYDFLWKIRGFVDELFGGVGVKRGRRSEQHLRTGDAVDFWRVESMKQEQSITLYSEMTTMPGRGWLKFDINQNAASGERRLVVTAYFRPEGFWGRLYWRAMAPFHRMIFRDLLRTVETTAEGG